MNRPNTNEKILEDQVEGYSCEYGRGITLNVICVSLRNRRGDGMEVMTLHKWYDEDVKKVLWGGHKDNREIVLKDNNEGSLLINKRDIIALAHEFDLIVYPKDANL